MKGYHFLSDGDWIWTVLCEPTKYLLCIYAGRRNDKTVGYFVTKTLDKTWRSYIPTFIADGYKVYKIALERRYHLDIRPKPRRGRPKKNEHIPHPNLNYGQVIKTHNGKKLENAEHKVIFGQVPKDVLNTSAIERENLLIRLFNSKTRRKTTEFARSKLLVNNSLELYRNVRNLCNDRASLCIPRKLTDGTYLHVTPAMAMGVTDHQWNMRELMTFSYRNNIN